MDFSSGSSGRITGNNADGAEEPLNYSSRRHPSTSPASSSFSPMSRRENKTQTATCPVSKTHDP